jgi:vacuolar-type H+-ATPase subunit H
VSRFSEPRRLNDSHLLHKRLVPTNYDQNVVANYGEAAHYDTGDDDRVVAMVHGQTQLTPPQLAHVLTVLAHRAPDIAFGGDVDRALEKKAAHVYDACLTAKNQVVRAEATRIVAAHEAHFAQMSARVGGVQQHVDERLTALANFAREQNAELYADFSRQAANSRDYLHATIEALRARASQADAQSSLEVQAMLATADARLNTAVANSAMTSAR